MRYLCLLRGVNVGGKNKVSMAELKRRLEEAGFSHVSSFINSGNILLDSTFKPEETARLVEATITRNFKLDSELIKVRTLTSQELTKIVDEAPEGFGTKPDKYHSDVLFPLESASSTDIMAATHTHPEVDKAWEQNGVVYFQRLSARRTSSRLGRIVESPVYKDLTIRSWNTTLKLSALLQE